MKLNLSNDFFESRSVNYFYKMLSITLVILIVEEIYARRWLLHEGILFPRFFLIRPIPFIAYPFIEWFILFSCSIAIWIKKFRFFAIRIAFIILIPSTLMVFSNHKFLLLTILFFLSLYFQDAPEDENITCQDLPGLALVKMQLVIVYYITVAQKLSENFLSGETLKNTFIAITRMPEGGPLPQSVYHFFIQNNQYCSVLAAVTIIAEISIPLILNKRPIVGLMLLLVFHTSLSLLMPGLWFFGCIMFSMGILYLRNANLPI